jgi:hypothetical protein
MLRPNLVTIERRGLPAVNPATGARTASIATVNTNVPARIDLDPKGTMQWLIEGGTSFVQAALLILDGLAPGQYADVAPGQTVVVNGITYTVEADGRGAFPSVLNGDRVTDEKGTTYLGLAVTPYYVTRTLQVQLARGRAWS